MISFSLQSIVRRGLGFAAMAAVFLAASASAQDRSFTLQGSTLRLQDLSSEAEVFFQSMRYNRASNVWNLEVTVRNKGARDINGPVILSIDGITGTTGPIGADGMDGGSPGKTFYDLTGLAQNGLLAPGQTSRPRMLTLAFGGGSPVVTPKVFGSRPTFGPLVLARSINEAGVALGGVSAEQAGIVDTNGFATESRSGLITLPGETATWRFSKTNHLTSWRTFSAGTNPVVFAPGPRLTVKSTNTVIIGVASGGSVADAATGISVAFEPGSFVTEAPVTLTPLSGQGLPGFLPMGWSPLQAFWVDVNLTQARIATASVKPWSPIATSETAVFARWNEEPAGWVAVQTPAGNGSNSINVAVERPGVYALVVGDAAPVRPARPVIGSLLSGVSTNGVAFGGWTAGGRMNPPSRAASRNPDLVTALAELTFTNAAGLVPSGATFFCDLTEVYQLRTGSRRLMPGRDGFFVAYQRGPLSAAGALQSSVPIRPSLLLPGDELAEAILRVDVLAPDEFRGGVLATNGGQIAQGDLRVVAGLGSLTRDQAAVIRSVAPTNFSELALNGFNLVGGFELGVGDLGDGRRLALQGNIPLTNGLAVLARVLNEKGDYGLEPLERFTTDASGKLISLEPVSADRLPGLDGSGQFVLVGVQLPQVLLSGIARNVASQLAEGLSVRSVGTPWLTFSRFNGLFRLLSPAGPSSVQLRSFATSDDGEASLTLTNGVAATAVDVALSSRGPRVVSIQPTNGAGGVSRVASISITFTRAINPATLATGLGLFGSGGQALPAAVSLNLAGTVATLQPAAQLAAGTLHQVVLSTNLTDLQGRRIEGPLSFAFTTEAAAGNRALAALTIYEPTSDGLVPFFGSPGTAEPESPVILLNETSGRTSTVLSKPDGSFTNRIEGTQDDLISAVIVNRNGTRISVPASRQMFRDGRVGLFSGGGTVESTNELGRMRFIAEPGSIDGKTIFRFEGLTTAQLLQELGTNQPEGGAKVLSGFRLQREGPAQLVSADVSALIDVNQMGLQPGESPTNRAFVLCRNFEMDGVKMFEVVDKLEYEDGRLVSHSPPFLGAMGDPALNTFTMIMMGAYQLRHVVVGRVVAAPDGAGDVTENAIRLMVSNGKPLSIVRGALVFIDGGAGTSLGLRAGAITARANTLGFYSALVPYNTFNPSPILLRAYHPAFSGIRAVKVFTPEGIRAGPIVGSVMNLVFNLPQGSSTDTQPPRVQPLPPALVMPIRTNVVIGFRVTDDSGLPAITSIKVIEAESPIIGSTNRIVATNYTLTLGPAIGEGATQQRYEVDFKVDIGSSVTMEVAANDQAGNVVSNRFRFFFGSGPGTAGPSLPVGDPEDTQPPTVVASFPADYTMIGRDGGSDLVFEFSEPIDPQLATNADVVAISPPGVVVFPSLSANQRQLRLRIGGLLPGKDYSAVLQSAKIRDLSGNFMAGPRLLPFKTPPDLAATLQQSGPGAGTVSIGAFSFSIARVNGEGELQAHNIGMTDTTELAGKIHLPFFPRAIAKIPYYSFSMGTNGASKKEPILTNHHLIAVVGGSLGSDAPGQIMWVVDVTNPTNMVRIASEVANPDPAAAFTQMRWSPPNLFIGELNPEAGLIYQINLQAFILGGRGIAPSTAVPGLDANGDGDFVDDGDELPLPRRLTFFGNEAVITLADKRLFDDFDVRQGTLAVVMPPGGGKPGRFQLVLNGGSFVGDGADTTGALEYPDASKAPRRVLLDTELPVEGALGTKIISAALVITGNDIDVLDLSNAQVPVLLQKIKLPTIEGIAPGKPFTLTRSAPDEYAVGTTDGIYYLRRSLLWHPDNITDKPPAVTRRVSGSLAGRVVAATDLEFVGSAGGSVFMKVRDPYFRLVSAQGYAVTNVGSIISKGGGEVQSFKSRWSEPRILTPAWKVHCPPGVPPALGSSNSPPHEAVHFYAVLRASGRAGTNTFVTVESLDLGGQLARPAGKERPAVFVGSSAGTIGVDQMQPAVEALRAQRLSDDMFSDDFNTFVTDAIVLVREPLSKDEKDLVKNDGRKRTVLWAGDNLRLALDDGNTPLYLAPFKGKIVGSRFAPVVQRIYKAFRAEMADSPNRSFPSAAPRYMGVDLQGGEAREVYPDILIEGREQALNLTRVYESRSRYVGPFGRGWDFSLNARLQEIADDLALDFRVTDCPPGSGTNAVAGTGGDLMFYDGAGNAFRFTLISEANKNTTNFNLYARDPAINEVLGSGGTNKIARFYESPPGIFSVLYKFKDGTWWMVHPTGIQMFFDGMGRITKSKGRSKDSLITFKYREDGKLDRVTGDRGLYLEFGYYYPPPAVINSGGFNDTPSDKAAKWGRICKVRAQSSLSNESEVDYEYDDTGNLLKAKPKFGAETVHAYDAAEPDLLLKVGRGDGSEEPGVTIGYDPKGLVSTLTVDGQVTTFAGAKETSEDRAALPSSTVSFTKNGHQVDFEVDDKGRPTKFANRDFKADDQGRPTEVADDVNEGRVVYDATNVVHRFRGNVIRTERGPKGGKMVVTKMVYEPKLLNRLVSSTDANGIVTDYEQNFSQIRTKTGGGTVIRTDTLNNFNQASAVDLDGDNHLFSTAMTFGSGRDVGLITEEKPMNSAANTYKRNTQGQVFQTGAGNREQTILFNDDGQPKKISGTDLPTVDFTYVDGLTKTRTISSGLKSIAMTMSYADPAYKAKVTKMDLEETGLEKLTTDYVFDGQGRLETMTVGGKVTTYGYDGVRVTSETGPGLKKTAEFHPGGLLKKMTENGVTASFTYDVLKRIETSDQQGTTTTFTYDDGPDARTRLKTKEITGGGGASLLKERYTYDAAGRLATSTGLGGRIRTMRYFPDGKLREVEIDGVVVQTGIRDQGGRTTKSRLNDVEIEYSNFDAGSDVAKTERVTMLKSSRVITRQLTLDSRARLKEVDILGEISKFDYDDFSNLSKMTDPDGIERSFTHAPGGRMLSAVFSDGTRIDYQYNAEHLLTAISNSTAGAISYKFDGDNLVQELGYPDGDKTSYLSRDATTFEPGQIKLGDGETTQTLGYNAATKRLETTTADGETLTILVDGLGRQTAVNRGANNVAYVYNQYGEPVGETTSSGTWQVTLDSQNRLQSESYPSGLAITYGPDTYGLPTTAGGLGVNTTTFLGAGIWSEIRYTGGLVIRRNYASDLDLESIQYGAINGVGDFVPSAGFNYTLTPGARVLNEAVVHESGRSHVFDRHPAALALRLKDIGFSTASNTVDSGAAKLTGLSYTNGELHAPAQGSLSGDLRGYFPNLSFTGQRVVSADGLPVQYNKRGSVTNAPLYVRLPGQFTPSIIPARLEYDGFGMLKRVVRSDGATITYVRDGLSRIVEREVTGSPAVCEPGRWRYVWKGRQLIEEYVDAAGFKLLRRYGYLGGTLVSVEKAAVPGGALTRFAPLLNIVDSVGGYLNADGSLAEYIRFTAWGYPSFPEGRSSAVGSTLLFHGAFFDVETGLYQMGQRNLHPILARFLQRDSALFKESLAFYSGFNGDPASRKDGDGTFSGPSEAKELYDRVMAVKSAADDVKESAGELIPFLNLVRGHGEQPEDPIAGGLDAAIATSDFLLKTAALGQTAIGGDELDLSKAQKVLDTFKTTKDAYDKFIKPGADLIAQGLKLRDYRLASWVVDPKNSAWFGNMHTVGARFSVFDLDFDDLKKGASAAAKSHDQETLSHEFLGKLQEQRTQFYDGRKKLALEVVSGIHGLVAQYYEKTYGKREEKAFLVGGGILDATGKFLTFGSKFQEAKDVGEALGKVTGRAATLMQGYEVASSAAGRAAVVAAFDLGFAVGKLAIIAASDPEVAKAYKEQVKQFEEDGGWMTVGAGVLATFGMDEAANAIQSFHDSGGFSLQPYVDAVMKQRAYHQQRTEFYLNGISAP